MGTKSHSTSSCFNSTPPYANCASNLLVNNRMNCNRNPELLEKYDLKANDAILAEEKHLGLYEELINKYDAKFVAGGAAQNSARGAQVRTHQSFSRQSYYTCLVD